MIELLNGFTEDSLGRIQRTFINYANRGNFNVALNLQISSLFVRATSMVSSDSLDQNRFVFLVDGTSGDKYASFAVPAQRDIIFKVRTSHDKYFSSMDIDGTVSDQIQNGVLFSTVRFANSTVEPKSHARL